MKIGKFIKLGLYENIKIGYGTVDHKNLKTIYLSFNSWVEPMGNDESYDKIMYRTRRNIKDIFYNKDDNRFKKQCIVDLDIKKNGIKLDKRSFMNLEVTLFVNEYFDVKSSETKSHIKKIMCDIIDNSLKDKNLYNFNKTKK